VYRAKVRGTPDETAIARLRRGVRLDDGKTAPAWVRLVEKLPTKSWLEIAVREGRKHLVRRMCEAVGHPVEKLARIRLGPLRLGALPAGAWREVTPGERVALAAATGKKRTRSTRKTAQGAVFQQPATVRGEGSADAGRGRRARGTPPKKRRSRRG